MPSKKKREAAATAAAAKGAAKGGKESKAAARRRRLEEKSAKEKRKVKTHRRFDPKAWAQLPPLPSGLVAKLEVPKVKSKHQTYFEFAENTEKRKKLETTVTTDRNAPPGFEFVPIGDPTMTNACKEISREQGAMIFIVSSKNENALAVYDHVDRIGFHFRETIVDEARQLVGQTITKKHPGWNVEQIPKSQKEINEQTDAAIRDLFPRIPNTDRQQIIEHGFQKGKLFQGREMIGLQPGIPLARRVQLAVLAHIRHTHTRYDKLLRETSWENARRAVEPICLDFILKWRGDEETGRDQMDEILREVVIITDSEDEDDEDEDDENEEEDSSEEEGEVSSPASSTELQGRPASPMRAAGAGRLDKPSTAHNGTTGLATGARRNPLRASRAQPGALEKKAQRGFARYQAAYNDAITRRQQANDHAQTPSEQQPASAPRKPIGSPTADRYLAHDLPSGRAENHEQTSQIPRSYNEPQHGNSISDSPYRKMQRPPGLLIHRNEEVVRPHSDRVVYYQDDRTRLESPSFHPGRPRVPVRVGVSPPRHGLQDMLVRSVETPSSDIMMASPRAEGELVFRTMPQAHDTYQRRVVDGRVSPARHQVIIVDDDSPPQYKRRRLVQERDPGRLRPIPSGEHGHYVEVQQAGPPQGLYRPVQPAVARPAIPEQTNGHGPHRFVNKLSKGIYGGVQPEFELDQGPPTQRHMGYQPVFDSSNGSMSRQSEFGPGSHVQGPMLPSFSVSNQSRSHEMSTGPVVSDQNFIDHFSKTRPEPSPRDGISVVPLARSHQNYFVQDNDKQPYGNESARSFAPIHPARARSPIQYMARPSNYREEPVYYENHDPHRNVIYREQAQPLAGGFPAPHQVRQSQPHRQVIVLD